MPVVSESHSESTAFVNLCSDFNFSQMVTEPTRTSLSSANILDLILTTSPDLVNSITYLPGLSDHCFINFTLKGFVHRSVSKPKYIRDYNKADYQSINRELVVFLDEYMLDFSERTIETNWYLFRNKVNDLVQKYIPLRVI